MRASAIWPPLLPENALIVANNSRVLQARLLGSRATGGRVEFLLLTPLPLVLAQAAPDTRAGAEGVFCAEAEGLVRAGGSVREGETFDFGAGIRVTVLHSGPFGRRRVRLRWQGDLAKAFAATGHIPLPPYIKRAGRRGTSQPLPDSLRQGRQDRFRGRAHGRAALYARAARGT